MIPRFHTDDLILLGGADVMTDLFRVAIRAQHEIFSFVFNRLCNLVLHSKQTYPLCLLPLAHIQGFIVSFIISVFPCFTAAFTSCHSSYFPDCLPVCLTTFFQCQFQLLVFCFHSKSSLFVEHAASTVQPVGPPHCILTYLE